MEDDLAHFYIAVAELCGTAHHGNLQVEIITAHGETIRGIPAPAPSALRSEHELDHTGYANALFVGDIVIELQSVCECRLYAPEHVTAG